MDYYISFWGKIAVAIIIIQVMIVIWAAREGLRKEKLLENDEKKISDSDTDAMKLQKGPNRGQL